MNNNMHRYFQINEEQLKYLIEADIRRIKSWKYYNNFQKFSKKYPDHTYEFNWFNPKETGLNNEILLDECANYIHDKHPLFIYFRNGKSLSENLIPVAVHRYKPFLLDNKIRLKISENSLHKIFSFIKNNYYAIVEYANGRIGYEDALNCFKMQALNEQMLVEMPIFNDYELHLPTSIWIDGKRDLQHGRRIKFKDTESNNSRNWATMSIDKFNPIVKNLHKDTFLKPSDIERIKRFVILNYDILNSLATDKSFNYEKQFLPYIIKLGKGEGYIIPQERFADNTNHTIYISCSVTDDRLWFMTNDNNQNTEHLMIEIGNTEPFEFFDKYTVYVDLNKHRDVVANIFNLGEIIKKIATNYNINVTLTNLNSIIKTYGF